MSVKGVAHQDNVADAMTKSLGIILSEKFREQLGLFCFPKCTSNPHPSCSSTGYKTALLA